MSASQGKLLDDRCPRCFEPFHCGAAEPRCDCFDLQLSQGLQRRLAAEYTSCLCISCLKTLHNQEQVEGSNAAP